MDPPVIVVGGFHHGSKGFETGRHIVTAEAGQMLVGQFRGRELVTNDLGRKIELEASGREAIHGCFVVIDPMDCDP